VIRFLKKTYKEPDKKVILDFGCGSGRNTALMSEMGFNKVIALDCSKQCLDLTKSNFKFNNNIEYVLNNLLDIPLEDDSIDCIVAWGALYISLKKEREKLLKEMKRVLKTDGMLLANFRGLNDDLYGKGKEIEKNLFILDERAGNMKGFIYWFCDGDELKQLFTKAGFTVENIERNIHYFDNMKQTAEYYIVWLKNNL